MCRVAGGLGRGSRSGLGRESASLQSSRYESAVPAVKITPQELEEQLNATAKRYQTRSLPSDKAVNVEVRWGFHSQAALMPSSPFSDAGSSSARGPHEAGRRRSTRLKFEAKSTDPRSIDRRRDNG